MAAVIERKIVVIENRGMDALIATYRKITAEGEKLVGIQQQLNGLIQAGSAKLQSYNSGMWRMAEAMQGARLDTIDFTRDQRRLGVELERNARLMNRSGGGGGSGRPRRTFDDAIRESTGQGAASEAAAGVSRVYATLLAASKAPVLGPIIKGANAILPLLNPLTAIPKLAIMGAKSMWELGKAGLAAGGELLKGIGSLAVSGVQTLVSWIGTATKVAIGLAAAGTAIAVAFTKAAISAAVQRDTNIRSITALMGSTSAAQKMFAELQKLSLIPGTTLQANIAFSRSLMSVGASAEFTLRFLKEMANINALNGGGESQMELASLQLMQMIGKGKVMGEDLRQIANSMPQFRQSLVRAFGGMDPEDIGKSGIPIMEVLKRVMEDMEKNIPRATSGAFNALQNLKMAWTELLVAFGKGFTGSEGIKVIDSLAEGLTKLKPIFEQLGQLAATVLPAIAEKIQGFFTAATNTENLNKWAKAGINAIGEFARFVLRIMPLAANAFTNLGNTIAKLGRAVGTFIQDMARSLVESTWLSRAFGQGVLQELTKAGNGVMRAAQSMQDSLSDTADTMRNSYSTALDAVAKAQAAATAGIDRMTAALKTQAGAFKDVASAAAAIKAGGAYSFAANGNAYNVYTPGQLAALNAGIKQTPNGLWGQPKGIQPGALTPERHEANWKAQATWREAQARERSRLAIEREMAARAENSQQLANTVRSQYGSSMSDTLSSAFGAIRDYQQGAQMAEWGQKFGMQYMLQRGFEVGRDAMARGAILGLSPMQMMAGGQLPYHISELANKLLGGKQKGDAKENRAITIEGDYRAQRERESLSFNDRLAQQTIGNLGAGDQGILSQAKLGQRADVLATAARRAGTDIGAMIADAIGYALPKAVEAAVARRLRLDFQGAN